MKKGPDPLDQGLLDIKPGGDPSAQIMLTNATGDRGAMTFSNQAKNCSNAPARERRLIHRQGLNEKGLDPMDQGL